MKKITFLLSVLLMGGCSVESTDDFSALDSKAKVKSSEVSNSDPMGFYKGKSGDLHGTLEIWNDCNNLYLQIIPNDDSEPEDVGIWLFTELPTLNGGGNQVTGESQYDLDDAVDLTWSFPVSNFDTEQELLVFFKAWGSFAGTSLHEEVAYTAYEFSAEDCALVCESGYMIGSKDFSLIGTSNNWGWAHPFDFTENGSETREIHHKNGSLGGEVTITYNNGIVEITEGEGVTITHLYISNIEPTETNAPGQFDKTQNYMYPDGKFWVMLKAEVCN